MSVINNSKDATIDEREAQSAPAAPLRDRFHRPINDLRISVIDACNFRCNYCMPIEKSPEYYSFLHPRERLTFAEIARLVRLFVPLGVRKIRLTGGEPLLRKNLAELVTMIRAIDRIEDLTLTTNGYWLGQHAAPLKEAGLQRINVSLDAIEDSVFAAMNGRGIGIARVLDGIREANRVGLTPVKINTVVQKGVNDDSLMDMVTFCREHGHVLRFIEYMDVGNLNHWQRHQVVPAADIVRQIDAVYPLHPVAPNYRGEVAQRYAFDDGKGEVGFIASVTKPFCGTCHRARLSADGRLYTCLFAGTGSDLRGLLRNGVADAVISDRLREIWTHRDDRYSELRASDNNNNNPPKVEMYQIGG
jgi:cyclic pyranopterin phosphate synthase